MRVLFSRRRTQSRLLLVLATTLSLGATCEQRPPAVPPPPGASPTPHPSASPTPEPEDPLAVAPAAEPLILAAWAEPASLPPGGGQAQLLVRVQKKGARPYPGVEVRFGASAGTLYSTGKVLQTDPRGMTRDRLTTKQTARVTVNAGGTRYSFRVPVSEPEPQ